MTRYIVPEDRFYRDKKGRIRIREPRRHVIIGWCIIGGLFASFFGFLGVFAWAVAATHGAWTLAITLPGEALAVWMVWEAANAR